MEQRLKRAGHYRQQANRYAEMAKTAELDLLVSKLYRKTAVRYVLMAQDLERWPDPLHSDSGRDGGSLWDRAERFLAEARQASWRGG
jgi:hypothetical protein